MPESLGRLRAVRRIGAGGFASVWLYRDEQLDSYVAVKALADNWAQQLDVRERFLEEARVLRRAASDHVVEVYDLGETDDGTPYFVMTYADQGTVADLLRAGPVDAATTIDLIEQACRGVADLHAAGVVHRDIKPPNLLLRSDRRHGRRLLVADLGLAKALMYASGLTQIVGTPAYMAPEQGLRGGGVDERADVHALGAVAYHLLSGRPMRDVAIGDVGAAESPEPLSRVVGTSEALNDAVMRAVQPDPADRWPDALAFAAALRAATDGHPPPIPIGAVGVDTGDGAVPTQLDGGTRIDTDPPAASGSRRRRVWVIATAAVAVLAAIALIAAWSLGDDDDPSAGGDTAGQGDGSTPSTYCGVLEANWKQLEELESGGLSDVTAWEAAVEAIHEVREAAPADIEGAWARVDDPFQEFVAVLDRTGTTSADIEAGAVDPDDERTLRSAVDRLGRELDSLTFSPDIQQHALSTCELDLNELSSD